MTRTTRVPRGSKKVQKNFRLAPDKIAAAQRILGASTATATIETALDLVILRQNLMDGPIHQNLPGRGGGSGG